MQANRSQEKSSTYAFPANRHQEPPRFAKVSIHPASLIVSSKYAARLPYMQCPSRGGAPAYRVTPTVNINGYTDQDVVEIEQDEMDRCRQEYTSDDFNQNHVPGRSEFINGGGSAHFSFSEINTGDYSWAIFTIFQNLEDVRTNYGYPMPVNSGYRNPVKNRCRLDPPGAPESRHIYGDAADIDVRDNDGDGDLADDSAALRQAAYNAAASYVREYPERNYSHVHMDWR